MQDRDKLDTIAGRLRLKEDGWKEYDVLEDEAPAQAFIDDFMPSWIYSHDYEEGLKVKKKYIDRYKGIKIEDAISGRPVANELGDCYLIEDSFNYPAGRIEREQARRALLSDLKLVRGIGSETEKKLRFRGYDNIESLLEHPKWRGPAQKFLDIIDSNDPCRIQEELWHWLPKSHPLNLNITAFTDIDRMVVLDIETMGLFSRPIILFGAAYLKGDKIHTCQYLVRDLKEEPSAIAEFCSVLEDNPLVSYNGRSFDVPYINQRKWYYDLGEEIRNIHFDMLHFARRTFKGTLPDARLTTIEKYLFGSERKDDVPGALVPEFYEEYLRTGNPGPLVPIVEHNKNDLVTLARLFSKLCKDECENGCNRRIYPGT